MKKSEIKIGEKYIAKVTGVRTAVLIDAEHPNGGWSATNVKTGRKVRIKSAQRLHRKAELQGAPKAAAKKRQTLQAQAKADQKNARMRDEREAAPDGMTASERAMAQSEPDAKQASSRTAKKRDGMSCLDAAAMVLGEAGEPMTTKAMVEAMAEKSYWASDAATPWATLYSAIGREIKTKGEASRFAKAQRGKFELARSASAATEGA